MADYTHYNIRFSSPPSQARLGELKSYIVDTWGARNFVCESPNGDDILKPADIREGEVSSLDPDYAKVANISWYQVYLAIPDNDDRYRWRLFWLHYGLIRFLLAQPDIEALYKPNDRLTENEGFGDKINEAYVETFFAVFMRNGYFCLDSKSESKTPNNPIRII